SWGLRAQWKPRPAIGAVRPPFTVAMAGDWRSASAMATVKVLNDLGVQVRAWDAAVSSADISAAGIAAVTNVPEAIAESDAVLILSDNRRNIEWEIAAPRPGLGRLIFDGPGLLDKSAVENVPGFAYATMGYITPPR